MRLHNMFKKTGEKITSIHSRNRRKPEAPEGILKKCNKCGAAILTDEVINGKYHIHYKADDLGVSVLETFRTNNAQTIS